MQCKGCGLDAIIINTKAQPQTASSLCVESRGINRRVPARCLKRAVFLGGSKFRLRVGLVG